MILLLLFLTACGGQRPANADAEETVFPAILTDSRIQWNHIDEVRIVSDGFFNRTPDEPLLVTDEESIAALVNAIRSTEDYSVVEVAYEGINSIFVDFGNGVVVSMYEDMPYGSVGTEMVEHGNDVYLPEAFYQLVTHLLEQNA